MAQRVKTGHDLLVQICKADFGYDLPAWHNHMKELREGGYTWGRNIELPKVMLHALESSEWRDAVREIEAG